MQRQQYNKRNPNNEYMRTTSTTTPSSSEETTSTASSSGGYPEAYQQIEESKKTIEEERQKAAEVRKRLETKPTVRQQIAIRQQQMADPGYRVKEQRRKAEAKETLKKVKEYQEDIKTAEKETLEGEKKLKGYEKEGYKLEITPEGQYKLSKKTTVRRTVTKKSSAPSGPSPQETAIRNTIKSINNQISMWQRKKDKLPDNAVGKKVAKVYSTIIKNLQKAKTNAYKKLATVSSSYAKQVVESYDKYQSFLETPIGKSLSKTSIGQKLLDKMFQTTAPSTQVKLASQGITEYSYNKMGSITIPKYTSSVTSYTSPAITYKASDTPFSSLITEYEKRVQNIGEQERNILRNQWSESEEIPSWFIEDVKPETKKKNKNSIYSFEDLGLSDDYFKTTYLSWLNPNQSQTLFDKFNEKVLTNFKNKSQVDYYLSDYIIPETFSNSLYRSMTPEQRKDYNTEKNRLKKLGIKNIGDILNRSIYEESIGLSGESPKITLPSGEEVTLSKSVRFKPGGTYFTNPEVEYIGYKYDPKTKSVGYGAQLSDVSESIHPYNAVDSGSFGMQRIQEGSTSALKTIKPDEQMDYMKKYGSFDGLTWDEKADEGWKMTYDKKSGEIKLTPTGKYYEDITMEEMKEQMGGDVYQRLGSLTGWVAEGLGPGILTLEDPLTIKSSGLGIGSFLAGVSGNKELQEDWAEESLRTQAKLRANVTIPEYRDIFYEEMHPAQKIGSAFTSSLLQTAAWPITLPQTIVKYVRGEGDWTDVAGRISTGETYLPDVGMSMYMSSSETAPGAIGATFSDVMTMGESGAWQKIAERPLEGTVATLGEIIGFKVGGYGAQKFWSGTTKLNIRPIVKDVSGGGLWSLRGTGGTYPLNLKVPYGEVIRPAALGSRMWHGLIEGVRYPSPAGMISKAPAAYEMATKFVESSPRAFKYLYEPVQSVGRFGSRVLETPVFSKAMQLGIAGGKQAFPRSIIGLKPYYRGVRDVYSRVQSQLPNKIRIQSLQRVLNTTESQLEQIRQYQKAGKITKVKLKELEQPLKERINILKKELKLTEALPDEQLSTKLVKTSEYFKKSGVKSVTPEELILTSGIRTVKGTPFDVVKQFVKDVTKVEESSLSNTLKTTRIKRLVNKYKTQIAKKIYNSDGTYSIMDPTTGQYLNVYGNALPELNIVVQSSKVPTGLAYKIGEKFPSLRGKYASYFESRVGGSVDPFLGTKIGDVLDKAGVTAKGKGIYEMKPGETIYSLPKESGAFIIRGTTGEVIKDIGKGSLFLAKKGDYLIHKIANVGKHEFLHNALRDYSEAQIRVLEGVAKPFEVVSTIKPKVGMGLFSKFEMMKTHPGMQPVFQTFAEWSTTPGKQIAAPMVRTVWTRGKRFLQGKEEVPQTLEFLEESIKKPGTYKSASMQEMTQSDILGKGGVHGTRGWMKLYDFQIKLGKLMDKVFERTVEKPLSSIFKKNNPVDQVDLYLLKTKYAKDVALGGGKGIKVQSKLSIDKIRRFGLIRGKKIDADYLVLGTYDKTASVANDFASAYNSNAVKGEVYKVVGWNEGPVKVGGKNVKVQHEGTWTIVDKSGNRIRDFTSINAPSSGVLRSLYDVPFITRTIDGVQVADLQWLVYNKVDIASLRGIAGGKQVAKAILDVKVASGKHFPEMLVTSTLHPYEVLLHSRGFGQKFIETAQYLGKKIPGVAQLTGRPGHKGTFITGYASRTTPKNPVQFQMYHQYPRGFGSRWMLGLESDITGRESVVRFGWGERPRTYVEPKAGMLQGKYLKELIKVGRNAKSAEAYLEATDKIKNAIIKEAIKQGIPDTEIEAVRIPTYKFIQRTVGKSLSDAVAEAETAYLSGQVYRHIGWTPELNKQLTYRTTPTTKLGKAWDRYGNWWARRTGYKQYTIDIPSGREIPLIPERTTYVVPKETTGRSGYLSDKQRPSLFKNVEGTQTLTPQITGQNIMDDLSKLGTKVQDKVLRRFPEIDFTGKKALTSDQFDAITRFVRSEVNVKYRPSVSYVERWPTRLYRPVTRTRDYQYTPRYTPYRYTPRQTRYEPKYTPPTYDYDYEYKRDYQYEYPYTYEYNFEYEPYRPYKYDYDYPRVTPSKPSPIVILPEEEEKRPKGKKPKPFVKAYKEREWWVPRAEQQFKAGLQWGLKKQTKTQTKHKQSSYKPKFFSLTQKIGSA